MISKIMSIIGREKRIAGKKNRRKQVDITISKNQALKILAIPCIIIMYINTVIQC